MCWRASIIPVRVLIVLQGPWAPIGSRQNTEDPKIGPGLDQVRQSGFPSPCQNSAPGEIRTRDRPLRRRLLFQLSYGCIKELRLFSVPLNRCGLGRRPVATAARCTEDILDGSGIFQ